MYKANYFNVIVPMQHVLVQNPCKAVSKTLDIQETLNALFFFISRTFSITKTCDNYGFLMLASQEANIPGFLFCLPFTIHWSVFTQWALKQVC